MAWWTDHVLPRLVDVSLGQGPVMRLRERVCAGLSGQVLEVGFGGGLNLRALPQEVTGVDAVDPSDVAWRRSEGARAAAGIPVRRVGLDGQRIGAADATYDAALVTFSLCTIPDAEAAVAEIARVLRPGAALHVLEHGLSPDDGVRRWQRRLDGVQGAVAGGCHLTRDPLTLLAGAGFRIPEPRSRYLGVGPARPFTYVTWGVARSAG